MNHHCSDCFNDLNEIMKADFEVHRHLGSSSPQYYCRHHVSMMLDLFINENLSDLRNHVVIIRIKEN